MDGTKHPVRLGDDLNIEDSRSIYKRLITSADKIHFSSVQKVSATGISYQTWKPSTHSLSYSLSLEMRPTARRDGKLKKTLNVKLLLSSPHPISLLLPLGSP